MSTSEHDLKDNIVPYMSISNSAIQYHGPLKIKVHCENLWRLQINRTDENELCAFYECISCMHLLQIIYCLLPTSRAKFHPKTEILSLM